MLKVTPTQTESPVMNRTLVGDDELQNKRASSGSSHHAEDIPFCNGDRGISLTELTRGSTTGAMKEKRPDTGQVPDDFFNPPADPEDDAVQTNAQDSGGFGIGQGTVTCFDMIEGIKMMPLPPKIQGSSRLCLNRTNGKDSCIKLRMSSQTIGQRRLKT